MMNIKSQLRKTYWAWIGLAAGVGTYVGCLFLQPWYGYTVLLRAPDLAVYQAEKMGRKSGGLESMFGGSNISPFLSQEAQKYLDFTYVKKKRPNGSLQPYLSEVSSSKDVGYLELLVHGISLQEAEQYSDYIVSELRTRFQTRISDIELDIKNQLSILENQVSENRKTLEDTRNVGKKLGFSIQILELISQLEKETLTMQLQQRQLQSSISAEKLFNFQILDQRPVDAFKPIFPKKGLFSLAMASLVAAILFFFFQGPGTPTTPVTSEVAFEERKEPKRQSA